MADSEYYTSLALTQAARAIPTRVIVDYVSGRSYSVGELVVSGGTLYRIDTAHSSTTTTLDTSKATALGGGGGASVTLDADGTLVVDGTTVEVGTDAEIAAAIVVAVAAGKVNTALT